jgi:hypothetical protein
MNLDDSYEVDELPAPPRKNISEADRQLLELAARALGAQFEEVDGEGYGNLHFDDGRVVNAWNPLMFSGDTFDLAVDLELDVMPSGAWVGEGKGAPAALVQNGYGIDEVEEHAGDPKAATRRAVTRVAAEIGKTKL